MMKPYDISLAFGQAYEVFGLLLQAGITPQTREQVSVIPTVEATLPTDNIPFDQLAAEHYRLFGMDVFPFEAMFLGNDNQLGTEVTEAVSRFYGEVGWQPRFTSDSPDHIANELALMSFLCWAESDAHEDNRTDEAQRMRYWQRRFLNEHLLRWLPALAQTVRAHEHTTYTALTDAVLDTVLDHRALLENEFITAASAFELSAPTLDLENEKTSLKDISRFLLTTSHSGLYISRADVARLGLRYRVPRGFGSRQQMLENLLHSSVRYEVLPTLLDDLRDMAQKWRTYYTDLADQHPTLQPIVAVWIDRLNQTDQTLERMKSAAIDA